MCMQCVAQAFVNFAVVAGFTVAAAAVAMIVTKSSHGFFSICFNLELTIFRPLCRNGHWNIEQNSCEHVYLAASTVNAPQHITSLIETPNDKVHTAYSKMESMIIGLTQILV